MENKYLCYTPKDQPYNPQYSYRSDPLDMNVIGYHNINSFEPLSTLFYMPHGPRIHDHMTCSLPYGINNEFALDYEHQHSLYYKNQEMKQPCKDNQYTRNYYATMKKPETLTTRILDKEPNAVNSPKLNSKRKASSRVAKCKKNTSIAQWVEDEISFLSGECSSILIILDSLRNVYSADIPSKNIYPLQTTLDFANTSLSQSDNERRGYSDKEREIRTAYDDLMLQARQLEKKIESLEIKCDEVIISNQNNGFYMTKERLSVHNLPEKTRPVKKRKQN